jgi:hypothetical protein
MLLLKSKEKNAPQRQGFSLARIAEAVGPHTTCYGHAAWTSLATFHPPGG